MSVRAQLARVRPEPAAGLTVPQKLWRVAAALALGAAMGLVAKATDSTSAVGDIGTAVGVWVLAATLLAGWSRSPGAAALHVFAFFVAMLAAYYTYSMVLFGFFPRYYFLAWGGVALLSPIAAYAAWYARGDGWLAALCASLPVALLLSEGRTAWYTLNPVQAFACFSALLLFAVLPPNWRQRLRMVPVVAVAFFLITRFRVEVLLLGWI